MTTVTFHMEGERLEGFVVKGHSGYAPAGEDILCAAVTSAVRFAECAVNDVMGLGAAVKVRAQEAMISLKLPGGLSQQDESSAQVLLTAMMVHLAQLQEEYPEHLFVAAEESSPPPQDKSTK